MPFEFYMFHWLLCVFVSLSVTVADPGFLERGDGLASGQMIWGGAQQVVLSVDFAWHFTAFCICTKRLWGILFIGAPYIVPFFISCWHNLNCWSRSFEVIWSCLLSLMLVSCFIFIEDFTVVWISHVNGAIYACQTALKHRYRHVNLLLTLSSCFL